MEDLKEMKEQQCFSSLKKTTFEFIQNAATVVWFWKCIKMETQKIGWCDVTRKWYVVNDPNNADYGEGNESGTTVKFETKVIKSYFCDYSDAYILVTGRNSNRC